MASIFMAGGVLAAGRDSALLALGMEHFRDTAAVTDDPARDETVISTQPGFVETAGPMKSVWHDEYLTAVRDSKSGQAAFRLEVTLTYQGDRRSYPRADLQGLGGPAAVRPVLTGTTSVRCQVGDCIYTDQLEIPVEAAVLRRLADSYSAGHPVLHTFRVIPRSGVAYRGEISDAEAAGLIARLDGYTPAAAVAHLAAPPSAPRRIDLGLAGLPVSASADDPARAGILVVEVNAGSVAQKAGIITGDIIDEVEGRPTRSLADLEAALGAHSAQATAAIKLFRGQKEITVKARF